jgi:signal transduction histidine kinase
MRKKLYTLFIEPKQQDEDLRNRELVMNVLLVGTGGVFLLSFLLLLVSFTTGYTYVAARIVGVGVCLIFIGAIYQLARAAQYQLSAYLLIFMYLIMATVVAYRWGAIMPVAVVLYSLVIVLAGILLGARYSVYAVVWVATVIIALNVLQQQGSTQTDWSWLSSRHDFGIILGFCIIFAVIGLVTWLFNFQMERSLHRAYRAEAALLRQKLLLETKVEERTRELQDAQFERVQQLYRFAELGQLSTALLHELANHLTTLTLDIEGLDDQPHSGVVRRAKRSIRYIDDMVLRVRDQLQGKQSIKQFNPATEVEDVVRILTHKAGKAGVVIRWTPPEDRKSLRCRGEPIRFRQVIANLLSNGIDASTNRPGIPSKLEVTIVLYSTEDHVIIEVGDEGRGVPAEDRQKLFEPFWSTKKTGMGLGLFISKEIVENHFGGTIMLEPTEHKTVFRVTLPKV